MLVASSHPSPASQGFWNLGRWYFRDLGCVIGRWEGAYRHKLGALETNRRRRTAERRTSSLLEDGEEERLEDAYAQACLIRLLSMPTTTITTRGMLALRQIALSPIPPSKVIEACSACFEQRTVFTHQVLARALNQMVDRTPLPLLFMRTVIQSIDSFPTLVPHEMNKAYASMFAPLWNEIVKSLREEDYISNREKNLLSLPNNNSNLGLVQWPLFLLSSKIYMAIDLALDCKDTQADLWNRICRDDYMAYAVQECYYSI